jgi:heme o synthase
LSPINTSTQGLATAIPVAIDTGTPPLWRDYLALTKPEISFLVSISALAGFLLGSPGPIEWDTLLWALTGVTLTAAGGCALNHYLERELDGQMRRTAARPIPSGRIQPAAAAWFGIGMVGAGLAVLCPLTNPLTGVLAGLTVVLYLFVYTPLKRVSTLNTFVGTIPGALPALGGFTAATGVMGPSGWAFFAVLVCWQIPHFYALAWMYRADYARAKFAMLSVSAPDGRSMAVQVVVCSILMVVASLVPVWLGAVGVVYAVGASLLGLWFARPVARFAGLRTNNSARTLLKATIYYIPVLVLLIIADRLLAF